MLSSIPEISSRTHHLPCFGRLGVRSPHPHSQPLFFSWLCLVLVAALGGWLITSLPLSVFAAFPTFYWEFSAKSLVLAPLPFSKVGSAFHPPSTVGVRLQFAVYVFWFCWDSICLGAALAYFPWGWVGVVSHKQLCSWPAGRNGVTFFSAVWCREAFHGLGIQDVTEFDSYWCSVFCLLGKNKKRNGQVFFFPQGWEMWDFCGC
jgi:hypothetical protein